LAACAQWWHAGHEIPVAVNLTAEDLTTDLSTGEDIWLSISQALRQHELPGQALHIEITEETLLRDATRTARLLQTARATGVKIALDDYGTGYSSLAYLRQLPVDVLKLDQVFARNIAQRTTTTIVRHTVAMAHGLGLRVVAEGIEDDATARALTDLGCDVGQGLFFSDALTPEAFIDLITGRTTDA
jgi:EAL domain-containing protein (putative c-di-GMP-specific phosphodiesterase class I)